MGMKVFSIKMFIVVIPSLKKRKGSQNTVKKVVIKCDRQPVRSLKLQMLLTHPGTEAATRKVLQSHISPEVV